MGIIAGQKPCDFSFYSHRKRQTVHINYRLPVNWATRIEKATCCADNEANAKMNMGIWTQPKNVFYRNVRVFEFSIYSNSMTEIAAKGILCRSYRTDQRISFSYYRAFCFLSSWWLGWSSRLLFTSNRALFVLFCPFTVLKWTFLCSVIFSLMAWKSLSRLGEAMVRTGLEPVTPAMWTRCSTNWANGPRCDVIPNYFTCAPNNVRFFLFPFWSLLWTECGQWRNAKNYFLSTWPVRSTNWAMRPK